MRSRSGTYQQKLTQVPIRPLIRGAVIVQDVNPVSPSDGMKIVLQQGVGAGYVVQKRIPYDYHFPRMRAVSYFSLRGYCTRVAN